MIKGTYLCIGPSIEPSIRIICKDARVRMDERKRLSSKPENVVLSHKIAFKAHGITHAIPAWSEQAMLQMCNYVGPNQDQVRALAAIMALDETIPTDTDNGDGGIKSVKTTPPKSPVSPDAIQLFDGVL